MHCPKKFLSSNLFIFFFSSPWQTLIFLVLYIVLPFPEYLIVGIRQCGSPPDRILSLSNMHLNFFQDSVIHQLLVLTNILLFMCTRITHLPTEECLFATKSGQLQLKLFLNICLQAFMKGYTSLHLSHYQEVQLLDLMEP